jgi:hypothetical protein
MIILKYFSSISVRIDPRSVHTESVFDFGHEDSKFFFLKCFESRSSLNPCPESVLMIRNYFSSVSDPDSR